MQEQYKNEIQRLENEGDVETLEILKQDAEVNNVEGIPELAQQAIERLKNKKEGALEVPAYQTNEMAEYGGSPAEIQPELDALNQEANNVVQSTEEKIHEVEGGTVETKKEDIWGDRSQGIKILNEPGDKIDLAQMKHLFRGDIKQMKDAFEASKNGSTGLYDMGFVEAFVQSPNTSSRDILDFQQMLIAEAFPGITADMVDRNEGISNMKNTLKDTILKSGKLNEAEASFL